jgi:hypothetical protein
MWKINDDGERRKERGNCRVFLRHNDAENATLNMFLCVSMFPSMAQNGDDELQEFVP